MNNILRNVLMRRSISQFDGRPVRDEDLMDILEEGKVLSNAANNQEWHFTIIQNRPLIRKLYSLRIDKSSPVSDAAEHLPFDAPVLMVISGRTDVKYAEDAANMVFGSMMLAADKYRVASCWLASAPQIFATEEGQKVLNQMSSPGGYTPLCVGAFGYKRAVVPANVFASEDNIVNIIK